MKMKEIKQMASLVAVAFISVGIARLFGNSEEAGLFGAIIGTGIYLLWVISDETKQP